MQMPLPHFRTRSVSAAYYPASRYVADESIGTERFGCDTERPGEQVVLEEGFQEGR